MMFLAAEVDNNTLLGAGAVAILGMFLFLMKFHAALTSYIKDVNNQKPEGRELLGQPIKVAMEEKVMTEARHTAVCGSLHQRVVVLENDVRAIWGKMETDKNDIIASGEERVRHLHVRMDEMNGSIAATPARTIELLKATKGLI